MNYHKIFHIDGRENVRFCLRQLLRRRMKGLAGFGLAGALVCYLYGQKTLAGWGLALAMAGGFAAVFAAGVLATCLTARRKAGHLDYRQEITINGFGVRVSANGAEAKVGFDKLHAVEETAADFYLYLDPDHAWILCKGQMEDPAGESRQLRELFVQVLEAKRLKLRK